MNSIDDLKKLCIRITRRCNLTCEYCLAPFVEERELSTNEIVKITAFLKNYGLKSVSISGGEPFVRKDVNELLEELNNLELFLTLTSNCTFLLDSNILALLKSKTRLKVSVHGNAVTHKRMTGKNVFYIIDRNIDRLIEYNVAVSLNTLITARNLDAIQEVTSYALEKGIKRIRFIIFIPRGRGYINSREFMLRPDQVFSCENKIKHFADIFKDRLDIRYSNFFEKPYFVLEPNGLLLAETQNEKYDKVIWNFKKGDLLL